MLPCLPTSRTFEYGGLRSVLQWADRQGGGFPQPLAFFSRQTFGGRAGTIFSGGSVAGLSAADLYYQRQVFGGRFSRQLSVNALWDAPGDSTWTVRIQLTAARTYYVRTDGSDSNDGLADTAGGAFLTIQKAIDVATTFDNGGFDVVIQVGAGTRTASNTLESFVGSGTLTIRGDTATPSNVVINCTGGACFGAVAVLGKYHIEGFKLTQATAFVSCVSVEESVVTLASMDFGASTGIHIFVANNGNVRATGNYSITGGAQAHYYVDGAILQTFSRTITLTGTPAFSLGFVVTLDTAFSSSYSMTFSGSATGKRYDATTNSVILTGGGGANYFPGGTAGTTATGGQYS
jgi:hypothetical protein